MNEWPRLFLLLALAGVVVTLLGSAAAWLMDEERRIRRALKRVLKGPAEAVIIARGRGRGAGFNTSTGRMGVACGSSTGSTDEIKAFGNMLLNSVAEGLNANSYVRMMPHTTAANISIFRVGEVPT